MSSKKHKKKGTQAQAQKEQKEPATTENNNSEEKGKEEQVEDQNAKAQDSTEVDKLTSNLVRKLVLGGRAKDEDEEDPNQPHAFWDTQPVPHISDKNTIEEMGPIDAPKTVQDIRPTPYNLPAGYEWSETDMTDEKTMQEVYELLNQNYVEDDDNMFRFDYSPTFLRWAVTPPGYLKQWHVGVRVSKNRKLVGYITAIPATISVYGKHVKMVEINFLCVHKILRDKRLAPVLIKEITRRVNLENIWQATYTAGRVLPKPVGRCRYYHRSLNPKKLISVGFSHLHPKMTMNMTVKFYRVPEQPQCTGIREMQPKDVPSVTKLLNNYLKQYTLAPVYEEKEVAHWFLPIKDVINTYVIEDPQTHEITDITSFYTLPSTIIGNEKYKILRAAYSYYNVATTVPLTKLINDALIFAKKLDYDVMNCLDVMENDSFLKDLKFGKGDGNLQYYLYNWRCPEMEHSKVGLVLL